MGDMTEDINRFGEQEMYEYDEEGRGIRCPCGYEGRPLYHRSISVYECPDCQRKEKSDGKEAE